MRKCKTCKDPYEHYGQKTVLCRLCKRRYDREYHAARTEKTKTRKVLLQRERIKALKKVVDEYKTGLGCSRCLECDPVCLDFHHIEEKELEISNAVRCGWSEDKIFKEIKKCIILCANCHRKEHVKIKLGMR